MDSEFKEVPHITAEAFRRLGSGVHHNQGQPIYHLQKPTT